MPRSRIKFSRLGDCWKCGGSGKLPYQHITGGKCLECKGTGGNRPETGTYKVIAVATTQRPPETTETLIGYVVKKGPKRWQAIQLNGEEVGELRVDRPTAAEALRNQ